MPAIELTKAFKGTQTGNVIFWLTIMLGQPMIVLLYARDYHQGMYGPWTAADTQTVANILLGFTTTWQQAIGVMTLPSMSLFDKFGLPPPPVTASPRASKSSGSSNKSHVKSGIKSRFGELKTVGLSAIVRAHTGHFCSASALSK